jgi:hypothetical protein
VIFLALFLIEIFLLSLLSKHLINSIFQLVYYMSKSREVAAHFLAFIFLPGTIIHELSHVISAGVLMVQTGEIEFIPEVHEGGIKLGTAEIGKTDPIRRSLIGIAPVLAGLSIIIGGLYLFSSNLIAGNDYSFWIYSAIFYALFVVGNTMFSSKKDLEGVIGVGFALASILAVLYFIGLSEFFIWISNFIEVNSAYIYKANIFLFAPIAVNLIIVLLTKLVARKIY